MHKTLLLLAALMVVGVTSTAWAQEMEEEEAPAVLRLSWFMCDFTEGKGAAVEEQAETQVMPIWEEMIAEGMGVQNHGYIYHWWADEWNLGIYTIGESIPAIIAAVDAAGDRMDEQYGEDAPDAFGDACGPHKDGFYTLGPSAGGNGE
jgi:hypothetical protein